MALTHSRTQLEDETFKNTHRTSEKDFTRKRSLPFALLMVLIMRKSVKPLQNVLNEAMMWLNEPLVTASAYSQARYKLKHTAFIELNQSAIVDTVYSDDEYHKFWGFRILAVDGSKVVLPNTEKVREEFGTINYSNGKNNEIEGEHPYALASVLYDVLNRMAVDARLGRAKAYEVDLAIEHLAHTKAGDLLTMDRNYPSYRMLAELVHRSRDFVIRCSAASFAAARKMLKGEGKANQIVTLKPCADQKPLMQKLGLPMSLKVRFVRVRLSTGEYEVLVTSLCDKDLYPTAEFLELYHLRWGIETFYGLLKTRLELENFTGTQAEAVRQDFHATVYLTGLESILTDAAQKQLDAKNTQFPQRVNRSVSFNAIKHHALELLYGDTEIEILEEKLTALFLMNPTIVRERRNPPRKKTSARRLLNFHKRQKKHCF
ncbi:IS4 family transposase [Methylomarinum sp. Ch1-1]|uniref:IS4 family transposase n=1 Tax=Methylomarinum roseum TaxID=3067653 RepID=A0AAU7NZZ9_9GAMM|nr:IS4 family transposase [Methylomarinum sp. Ch1-1]MDP4521011.1 IS4 family transposase [Methylomarinum sp. Ch1-1]